MLLGHRGCLRGGFEKVADLDAKSLRDLKKAARAHPIGAGLIFLDLLIGNLEGSGELLLSHSEKISPLANLLADVIVDPFRQICHAVHPKGERE